MIDKNGMKHKPKGEGGGQFTSSDGAGGTHEATEAEKRRMVELGITDSPGKDRKAQAASENKTTIKDEVKLGIEKLKDAKVLTDISKNQMTTDFKQAIKTLKEKLEKNGGFVFREGFGNVQVSSRLKQAGAYLKTVAEIAAFSAVPTIIEKGVLVDVHDNHKGRGYPSYLFAGKVILNGHEGIVAVVVKKTTGNFYKVHRVLTPDGKDIEIKNDTD